MGREEGKALDADVEGQRGLEIAGGFQGLYVDGFDIRTRTHDNDLDRALRPRREFLDKEFRALIEFDGEEYVALPVFDVRAAAGAGSLNQDEDAVTHNFFRHQWLRSVTNAAASALAIIQVDGDSMWDTLHHGDHVLVDRTQNTFTRDGIYALEMGEGLQVKRVSIHPTTKLLTVKSDNGAYPTWPDINPDDVIFAGRVIWIGRQV